MVSERSKSLWSDPASDVVDMSQYPQGLDLCKRCRCLVVEENEANDLCGLYPDLCLCLCPGGDENVCRDRRLQLANDLSSTDSSQISPCNPRRHWAEARSRQAEEKQEDEHPGLRRLRWSVRRPWRTALHSGDLVLHRRVTHLFLTCSTWHALSTISCFPFVLLTFPWCWSELMFRLAGFRSQM